MTKIAITFDTHSFNKHTEANLHNLCKRINKDKPDLLIHGGDIAEVLYGVKWFDNALNIFNTDCPNVKKSCVIGNHDLYVNERTQGRTSLELFELVLPAIAEKNQFHWLETENLYYEDIAIVGSYLHYDYSAMDKHGVVSDFIKTQPITDHLVFYARNKKNVIVDGTRHIGLPSDIDFANQLGEGFRKRLKAADENPEIKTIVVVTHIPCMPSQITSKPNDYCWSIGTPYFGNISHVDFIMNSPKVKYVASGHSHVGSDTVVTTNDGHKIRVLNSSADYGNPNHILLEM